MSNEPSGEAAAPDRKPSDATTESNSSNLLAACRQPLEINVSPVSSMEEPHWKTSSLVETRSTTVVDNDLDNTENALPRHRLTEARIAANEMAAQMDDLASGAEIESEGSSALSESGSAHFNAAEGPAVIQQPMANFIRVEEFKEQAALQAYRMGPHPTQSYEQVVESIGKLEDDFLKQLTRCDRIRQVLVIGATGKIGSLIIKQLGLLERESTQPLIIHCLVRANNLESAKKRLIVSLTPLMECEAQLNAVLHKTRVWAGDVRLPQFGLSDGEYAKVASRVEGIFNVVAQSVESIAAHERIYREQGEECAVSRYALIADVMVHSWSLIFELAATTRPKHIWAVSSLLSNSRILKAQVDEDCVSESQIDHLASLNRLGISPHSSQIGARIWANGTVEAILNYAKLRLGYPISIFRLPPVAFLDQVDICTSEEYRRAPPRFWTLLRACVKHGIIPNIPPLLMGLFSQPIDVAVKIMIQLCFCHKRIHWLYHVVDERRMKMTSRNWLETMLNQIGIFLQPVEADTFLSTVGSDTPGSDGLEEFINDLSALYRKMNLSTRVSVSHLKQDVNLLSTRTGTEPSWGCGLKFFGKKSIQSLLQTSFFPHDSKATLFHFEDMYQQAIEIANGLTDLGEDGELCREGWTLFLEELNSGNVRPKFHARCAVARTVIVYLTTQLYMRKREKEIPEILEARLNAPTFIVGLNRAGTSFTHSLMAADWQNTRSPVLLEMLFPYGPEGDYCPAGLTSNDPDAWMQDPRKPAADDLVSLQLGPEFMKHFGSIHPRESTSQEEDFVAFEIVGRSFSMSTGYNTPEHFEWLMRNDAEAVRLAYRFHVRFFKHLEYQRPGRRWVLKMPWHLLTIETLIEHYPDAEIVFIHRRPSSAVTSWCGMELMLHRNYLVDIDPMVVGRRSLRLLGGMIDKALDYQNKLAVQFVEQHPTLQPPQSYFYNLYFDQICQAPMVVLSEIYAAFDWEPLTSVAERQVWDVIEEQMIKKTALGKNGSVPLDSVGVDKKEIKQRFALYYKCYFDAAQREKRLNEYKIARSIGKNCLDRDSHYTAHGTIARSPGSWIDRAGLSGTRKSFETMYSYARSRFSPTT